MKPEELLSNFLVYNTPILNEIKNESKELSDAVNSVVTELFGKFILPTKEQNEESLPQALYDVFDLVVWKDGNERRSKESGSKRVGGVTQITWDKSKKEYLYKLVVQDPFYFLETYSIPEIPKNISNALNKYKPNGCADLFMQREESGTKTIAESNTFMEGSVERYYTTRQAQAAINAGEWLFINASLLFSLQSVNPDVNIMKTQKNTKLREQKYFWGQASNVYNVTEKDIIEYYSETNIKETPKETPKKTKWSEISTQLLKEELDANLEIIEIFDEDDPEAIKAADQNIEIEIELDNRN